MGGGNPRHPAGCPQNCQASIKNDKHSNVERKARSALAFTLAKVRMGLRGIRRMQEGREEGKYHRGGEKRLATRRKEKRK